MNKPLADYVKLPEFDEYKEWFKAFADLKREDGIVQVTWKTNDGPMHHSGMSHRAMSQLTRVLSLDFKNEIIIYTHIGDNWMIESDANGWETYSELPTERFQHQYFDDTNLIKNMIFDLDVPTIGAIPGPGFHWDSAMLCDVTICTEDTKMEVPHAQGGLVPGDGMGLMCQHYMGTKTGNYYMMTSRQFTAEDMLKYGMVSEVVPKGKALERAWEIARMWKTMPYENRTIMSNLAKRPLKKLLVEDLKLHTVSEQYGSLLRIPLANWATRTPLSRTRSTSAVSTTGVMLPRTWKLLRPLSPGEPCPRRLASGSRRFRLARSRTPMSSSTAMSPTGTRHNPGSFLIA
jgi:enoyl-CoA hydratase/carnithine racemase